MDNTRWQSQSSGCRTGPTAVFGRGAILTGDSVYTVRTRYVTE